MKLKNVILAVAGLSQMGLMASAGAAEFYPKTMGLRDFGTDQGNVGDCATQAEIGALENAFAARGYGYVKLSLFYSHAVHWATDTQNTDATKLSINDADRALFARLGNLIPDFMWPEDGMGLDRGHAGVRPHPSEAVIEDADFPATNVSETFWSLYPAQRFGNVGVSNMDALKKHIEAGDAVAVSVPDELLQPNIGLYAWNFATGFLKQKYDWASLMKKAQKYKDAGIRQDLEQNHSVVAVGYDDALYADQGYGVPGAIIVRNSWNDWDPVSAVLKKPSAADAADIKKMRLKLAGENLPEFYAIPYQYFIDATANNMASYSLFTLDYAAFAAKYLEIGKRYETVIAPYACDGQAGMYRLADPTRRVVKKFGEDSVKFHDKSLSRSVRTQAESDLYAAAMLEVRERGTGQVKSPAFNYALTSRHRTKNVDRAADLYGGKFNAYYCPSENPARTLNVWPTSEEYADPVFQSGLSLLASQGNGYSGWAWFMADLAKTMTDELPAVSPFPEPAPNPVASPKPLP